MFCLFDPIKTLKPNMTRNYLVALTAICTMAFFVSCKHKDKSILVPKDAAIVIQLDGASLASKLPWEDIKASNWYKDAQGEASDSLAKKLLDDPRAAGIEIQASFTFFVKKQGQGTYMALEGTVKDAAAFEAFNKKIGKDAAVTKDGNISQQLLDKSVCLSWNSQYFNYVFSLPGFSMPSPMSRGNYSEPYTFPVDSLKKFGKEILNLDGSANITDDSRFNDLLAQGGDCHFWFNTGEYAGDILNGALSMMKLDVLLKGNISATTLSFDNGKIAIRSKHYYNKEMSEFVDKYPAHPISADVYNRIPSKDIDGVMTFNYPPDGLKAFLKLIGVDGIVNSGLGKVNYSMDEFVKANKGDLVLAVSDFKVVQQEITIPGTTETFKSNKPDVKVLFATSVNDKPAFDKLIANVKTQVEPFSAQMPSITYTLNNGWFAAGNSADDVNKFLAGGNNNQPFAAKLGGHAFGLFIDIQKLITAGSNAEPNADDETKAIVDASKKMWKDMYAWGDAKTGSEAEINLVDANTNSLKQLNQYADKVAAAMKARQQKWQSVPADSIDATAPAMIDSIAPPPPPAAH